MMIMFDVWKKAADSGSDDSATSEEHDEHVMTSSPVPSDFNASVVNGSIISL